MLAGQLNLSTLRAETIRVGFYNAPPLMIQAKHQGIYHDLLQKIAQITGDTFKIEYYSTARLQRQFEEGKIDLEPGVNPQWRQASLHPGIYSIPFAALEQVVLFRPGTAFSILGPNSLKGRSVGTIRGYTYPGFTTSLRQGEIERIDVTDEPQLLRLLDSGRINQVFVDRVVQRYWAQQHPRFYRYPTSRTLNRVDVMLRLRPSLTHALPRINQAISLLQSQGVISQLFAHYLR
ncbi:substrate-binding periplasmic protein [Motiliproteus coralliicola]|uniref:substrate-binding periplasmic protein n=1 Tax=Motiliproteus coralliicola TaxID=2283196 RepID=UPI0014030B63|nr:transporter substrate-binding domain-containing protein [Motiliproteus coralliicola]